jgi:aspartate/tyrosine/aromatic aminotransferase
MSSARRLEVLADHLQPETQKQQLGVSLTHNQTSSFFPNYSAQLKQQLKISNNMSLYGDVPVAAPDPILGLNAAFRADTDKNKVNLGVGAYRTNEGNPYVLEVVRECEKRILAQNLNKEYIPQEGLAQFNELSAKLLLGPNNKAIQEKRVCTIQSISGTGALRIGLEFLAQFTPGRTVYVPNPTWTNHFNLIKAAGLKSATYRYFDAATKGLDFKGMTEDIKNAPNGSIILLHMCAHNPTGVDPTPEQWQQIASLMQQKNHITFFDAAYQGFASGDLDKDAYSVRYFVEQGMEVICTQSYAKNFGLYGERIGAINFVCNTAQQAAAVFSQMQLVVRSAYSSPPLHGARIVAMALSDPELYKLWLKDLTMMANRIIDMRQVLYDQLQKLKTPGDWTHILKQIGMFSFTGLNQKQCDVLTKKYHIYLTSNGRISMCGLNTSNVEYVAKAIDDVVRNVQ